MTKEEWIEIQSRVNHLSADEAECGWYIGVELVKSGALPADMLNNLTEEDAALIGSQFISKTIPYDS